MEIRRLSLHRFLTLVANHRVLSEDEYVIQFFTFRETIAVFKSSRTVLTDDESNNLQLTPEMTNKIPQDFDEQLSNIRENLKDQCERFNQICHVMEKYLKRIEG